MRVSARQTIGAAVMAVLSFSLAGCGFHAAASPPPSGAKKPAKHNTHQGTAPSGAASAPLLTRAVISAPPVSAPPAMQDNMTHSSATGVIAIDSSRYFIHLPGPGWRLVYAVVPAGILWTLTAPPQSHLASNATQAGFLTAVHLTSPAATGPQPVPLDGAKTLISPPTLTNATLLQNALIAGTDAALYSSEWALSDGKSVFLLYFIPYTGSPVQLLQRRLDAHQAVLAWPAARGAIVAQAAETQYGWRIDSVSLVNSARINQPTSLPATQWPLTVTTRVGSVILQSGPQITLIRPDGRIHSTWAAPNPLMIARMSTLLPGRTLFAPDTFSDALTGSWKLSASLRAYTLAHVAGPQNPLELTAQVTLPKTAKTGGPSTDGAAASQSGNRPLPTTVPSYFGIWRTEHEFQLSSSEGPTIQWIDAASGKRSVTRGWFASFRSGGWTYVIGPFTSPSDTGQTELLSYLIGRALTHSPTPLATGGVVNVRINPASGDFVSTLLHFTTASAQSIRLGGPGLEPLNTAADWTLWTPAQKRNR